MESLKNIARSACPKIEAKPRHHFVIYSQARAGSTMISRNLACSHNILCQGELFNALYLRGRIAERYGSLAVKTEPKLSNNQLDGEAESLLSQLVMTSQRLILARRLIASGYKFLWWQKRYHPGHLGFWRRNEFTVILNRRKNILRRIASRAIAKLERKWSETRDPAEELIGPLISIRTDRLLDDLEQEYTIQEEMEQELKSNDIAFIPVWHEDLVREGDSSFGFPELFRRLGCEMPVGWRNVTEKRNPFPLEKVISNYSEVESVLRNTEFEHFLEDQ